MPDQTWSKLKLVELIEKHVGPTEKLWKAKKSTLVKILHYMERGKIDESKMSNILDHIEDNPQVDIAQQYLSEVLEGTCGDCGTILSPDGM